MATTHVVLGLLMQKADGRQAIVQRYEECLFDKEFTAAFAQLPLVRRDEHGELLFVARDVVGTSESKIEAALLSLQERKLIEVTAVGRDSIDSKTHSHVYTVTSAGRAHFEWWIRDASTLDPLGSELREKLSMSDERHVPVLIELTRSQELLCLERLEELRRSHDRTVFARCTTIEELWNVMTADDEPMHIQLTVESMRRTRQRVGAFLDRVDEERRAAE
jgi:DNA-binding PadR family transcriptional regulator